VGDAVFRLVAGPDGESERARIHGTPGPRWFGEDSAIARVHGDASMFVGGLRAVLLQTLHPAAMTAVAEHSGYQGDLWGRLARTSTFLAATTFGPEEHAERAVEVVRAVHRRVTGTLPDGTAYAADDPHLLGWVHVAEVESFLLAHTVYGLRPLDAAGRARYLAEAGRVGARLGVVDPPATESELHAALQDYRPELRAIPAAHEAVRHLRHRAPLPLPGRPAYAALWLAAVDLLPAWARSELGLRHRPRISRPAGRTAVRTVRWALLPGQRRTRHLEEVTGIWGPGSAPRPGPDGQQAPS
jgi:uncharacterized protein (DUF2236 family)